MAHERTRVFMGNDSAGKPRYTQVSGRNQDERNDHIVRKYIESGRIWELLPPEVLENILPKPEEPPQHPFTAYSQEWYKRYKCGHLEENTKVCILYSLRGQQDYFGDKPIESIGVNDVQDYLNNMKHLSRVTIRTHRVYLTQIFDTAVEDELIAKNPVRSKRIINPGKESPGIQALPIEQMIDIMNNIGHMSNLYEALYVALPFYLGLRREEVLGLKWEDMDFATKRIHVQRAVTYPINQPVIKAPKTKSGNRMIAILDPVYELLLPIRKKEGFVFLDEGDVLFTQERLKIFARNVNAHIDLHGAGMRELRKCYATIRHAAGTPDKLLQSEIGHSSYRTTQNFYINMEASQMEEYRNSMVDYLTRKQAQNEHRFV